MAASEPKSCLDPLSTEEFACLTRAALERRLTEEIARAERHGTALSCLLVTIENLDEVAREHGSDLGEQTLAYVGAALQRELRRFDRIGRPRATELLVVLPGADDTRVEIVARRVLERVRAIKVESDGARRPLVFSLGLAAWRPDANAAGLIERARAATRTAEANGENPVAAQPPAAAPLSAERQAPPRAGAEAGPGTGLGQTRGS